MNIINIRQYIYDNISNLSDNKHNLLYDYIINNNILHSENKNGLFINLSLCNENHIQYFYKIINLNDKSECNDNILIKENIDINNLYKKVINKNIKQNIIIKQKNLNSIEKLILSYSFQ